MLPDRLALMGQKMVENAKMRHFEQFSNNVNRRNLCFPSTFGNCGQIKVGKGSSERRWEEEEEGD